jgi:hypothetical protein
MLFFEISFVFGPYILSSLSLLCPSQRLGEKRRIFA